MVVPGTGFLVWNHCDSFEVTSAGPQAVRIKNRSLHCPSGGWVGYMGGGDRVKDVAVSFSVRMRRCHGWFCSEVVV